MSRSAIYVVNNSTQEVVVDGTINPGSIIRRFGPGVGVSANGIQIDGLGYYILDSSITLAPTAAGEVTVTVFNNGIAIPGATATATAAAADDVVNLSINALIRETGCCYYNNGPASLTFVVTGTGASVTNIASRVVKI